MVSFKIIYYVLLVMFVLLASVFFWGFITYKRTRTETKFLNKPLFTLSIIMAVIGIAFTIVPLGMKLWIYDDSYIRSDPAFISILVFEFLFLVAFLILAYLFAYDFGIALDAENNTLQFFGQAINTEKIISLETKKNSLQVIYEQGYRNNKKKITIFTPKAKLFAKEVLVDIIARNQANREEIAAQQAILTQDINLDTNINEVNLENLDTTSVTTNVESNQEQQS
ncbi:hypothetical protein [Spiroplasma attinicola]|uniref:hypothetical protein n=1 Tax=Spiroplasma attinicola TaxID=2904537 RepID=UPI002022A192|nr:MULTISPECIES: hypothetical protein [unclassified Spiroplasma]MCL8209662.1 hypothetical protein [Spiroplasma sp. JKS002670]MCL8210477.1 hypothetical protein [Spiroplasma sp. JKS002671]